MKISLIAAVSTGNFAIGYKGELCYKIKEDLAHFKELTMGHTVIMGRKTAESLPILPLPGRRNIVLSKTTGWEEGSGIESYPSLELALERCSPEEEVFIIGGAQVYKEALPLADILYLTEVFDTPAEADTFFPSYHGEFICTERDYRIRDGLRYEFTKYERNYPT